MEGGNMEQGKGTKYYNKVKEYCEKQGISIHVLEKQCGIGNGIIGSWRSKNSVPNIETLEKLAQGTNTNIKEWIVE
jgi:transcriptional regulator with XRE-family HTH domain